MQLSRKAQALLYYLIVTQQTQSRARLAALFWPDMPDVQARKNLRNILPELRKFLDSYLYIDAEAVGFQRNQDITCDVHTLLSKLKSKSVKQNPALLLEATTLYRGDFLDGFFLAHAPFYEEWFMAQREQYRNLVVDSLYQAAQSALTQRDTNTGLQVTRRLLEIDRWHEAAHRLIMNFLWLDGQQETAVNYYQKLKALLLNDLRVEPDAATEQLVEKIRSSPPPLLQEPAGSAQPLPNNPTTNDKAEKISHNLPQYLTSFVGREAEISAICTQLAAPNCRLLTLFGDGGIGKTRLAVAVAQAVLNSNSEISDSASSVAQGSHFPDGIWFVSFSEVTTTSDLTEQLAVTVAQALQVHFSGNQPLFTQLLVFLRKKVLLLIVDNAEHLLPEIANFLVKILQSEREIKVIVTSRHVLNLQAEFVWQVTGLTFPNPEEAQHLTKAELDAFSSISLFVERAKRVNRNFQLTLENQAEIASICQLVEGLPLAIELAAMLTKQYRCDELVALLHKNYAVLATDLVDLPAKHRSIKTVLDYSWKFLNSEEARILAECSIFEGGFTYAAAAAIMNASEPVLIKLADQSLLQLHEGRFTIHQLVHQYAAAHLAQFLEQQQSALRRHATYYLGLFQGLAITLELEFDAQQVAQDELYNLRSAWLWSAAQGDLRLLATGLAGLECYYRLSGIFGEAIYLLEQALNAVRQAMTLAPADLDVQRLLVRLLCHITQFYRRLGQPHTGETLISKALALAQQLNEPALLGLTYHELARLAQVRGDFTTMHTLAEQGSAYARSAGAPYLIAELLNDIGVAVSFSQNPLAARPHFQDALQSLQKAPNRYLEGRLLDNLGGIHLLEHEYARAYQYLQPSLILKSRLRDQGGIVILRIFLGDLWRALGFYDLAQQMYLRAQQHLEVVHDPYWKSWLYANFGHLQILRGTPSAGVTLAQQAQQIALQSGILLHKQWATLYLGDALMSLGDHDGAAYCYQQVIDQPTRKNWIARTVDAHAGLATLRLAKGDVATAMIHSEAALTIMAQQGLAASSEPFQVYWNCICVLKANNDPRAEAVLRTAYGELQRIANDLEDVTWRHSFLENVVTNRNLIAMAHVAGIRL
ncbi:MAG: BTAD domain-containing putative transcriptional regulator [Caldilineaceae bacterium]